MQPYHSVGGVRPKPRHPTTGTLTPSASPRSVLRWPGLAAGHSCRLGAQSAGRSGWTRAPQALPYLVAGTPGARHGLHGGIPSARFCFCTPAPGQQVSPDPTVPVTAHAHGPTPARALRRPAPLGPLVETGAPRPEAVLLRGVVKRQEDIGAQALAEWSRPELQTGGGWGWWC